MYDQTHDQMHDQIKFPRKWVRLVILTTFNGSLILGSTATFSAPIPLTQATLRKVVNRVDLLLSSQAVRSAQVNDRLSNFGDAVKTQRASRTELKFNDGTLAKVGELATFRFTPNTRRFELGNGTYLFLVPPGRGNTEFNTPNAKAGIKGSALFIRYIEESETTIMGALTNNPLGPMDITVGGKKQDLYAGQMLVAIKDRIDRVETFDLTTFFRTSPMYRDIDFTDPDLQAVRQEMTDAVTTQVTSIGTLPPRVETLPKPGISSDPTSNIPRRESTEAREALNNPNRNQPIVKPSPPSIVEPPIVKPTSPNIVEPPIVTPDPRNPISTEPITKPLIPEVAIVKPTPPNIKIPPTTVPPKESDPGIPIVKPTPPNIKDPIQHQYSYVTVYINGKPVVYLKVDGRIDYSQVIEFIKPPIGPQPQPAPIETPSLSTPPSQPAPVESINIGAIRVVPIESSKPPVEKIPVIEIKPQINDPVNVIKSAIESIKSLVDSVKTPVEIVKPTIESIKPPLDLIKVPVEIVKPAIEVITPSIVPDVIKLAPAALTEPPIFTTPPITPPTMIPPITPTTTTPPITPTTPPVTPPTPPITPPTPPITPPTPPVTPPTPPVTPPTPPITPTTPPVTPPTAPPITPPTPPITPPTAPSVTPPTTR